MHTTSDKELLLRTDLLVYIVNDAIPISAPSAVSAG
jgi:hypothetical protein